jgi:hypothetical protein
MLGPTNVSGVACLAAHRATNHFTWDAAICFCNRFCSASTLSMNAVMRFMSSELAPSLGERPTGAVTLTASESESDRGESESDSHPGGLAHSP